MKVTVERKKEETKEIELPYFCKSSAHTYKIYSEYDYDSCVQITYDGSITIAHSGLPFIHDNLIEITEKEYLKELNKAIDKLKNL
tara:strand:+ start:317 stop:571 length:255 start_codon:yes stop_codon:yes gene_type:complete